MRVFKTKLIRLQLTAEELDALTADFISYKRDGVLPDIFGRDALYDDSFTWPLIKFERVAHKPTWRYAPRIWHPVLA